MKKSSELPRWGHGAPPSLVPVLTHNRCRLTVLPGWSCIPTTFQFFCRNSNTMKDYLPMMKVILRDKLVDDLMEEVRDLRDRLDVAETLTIRQHRREIAVGVLAEGVRVSDNKWTIDLEQQGGLCLLTDLLESEIRFGQQPTRLRIADAWRAARFVGWRLTDDVVLIEMAHADFCIRFTTVLEAPTMPVLRNAGLSILQSPQVLAAEKLVSPDHPIEIYLTTLHIRAVSNWGTLV